MSWFSVLMWGYILGFFVCMSAWLYFLFIEPRRKCQPPSTYEDALDGLMKSKTSGEVQYYAHWMKRLDEARQPSEA